MKILITGGAGFIGSNFVRYLLNYGYRINVLDKLTYAGRKENLRGILKKIKFLQADITNSRDVEKAIKGCKIVINFAAESHVDRSIKKPAPFLKTNILGTWILLEKALKHKIDLFIQVSSDEVYGSISKGFFKENSPLNPSSPYSASKASGDNLCQSYYRTFGLPIIIIRPCNNYGPRQYPEKLIPKAIINAIKGKKIPIYAQGENIRDWIYVEDTCRAIKLILEKGKIGEIYNVGAAQEYRNIDVVKMVLNYLEKPHSLIQFVADRPGHDFRYAMDWTKIKNLGWSPKIQFEKGLISTTNWYLNNENWWQKII